MEHKYVTCDVCGQRLNYDKGAYCFRPRMKFIRMFTLHIAEDDIDICSDCWIKLKQFVKQGDNKC